jgi:hypothetical protein
LAARGSFWRKLRSWPVIVQGSGVVLAVIVAAAIVGAVRGPTHEPRPSAPRPTSETSTADRASIATTTSRRPRATVAPITRATPPPTTPTTPLASSPALLPLAIAAPSHEDTYNRADDFGGFVDADHNCRDARAEVLIRSSQAPVTFTTTRGCTVKTGRWLDPWSGAVRTVAHDLQIDHTVPLANAWRSGAWSWTRERRVEYANNLVDTDHLVAILAAENESKGDDGPDSWRPPLASAWCRYALDWDHIKAKWGLSATTSEWAALQQMVSSC